MFDASHTRFRQLASAHLDFLVSRYPQCAVICKANMCGACAQFERNEENTMLQSLATQNIPYRKYECRDNSEHRKFLFSTGTSSVPCVIWINDGDVQVKTISEFQQKLSRGL